MGGSLSRLRRREYQRALDKAMGYISKIGLSAYEQRGWTKMFIGVSTHKKEDAIVIGYDGNEELNKSLGSDVILNIAGKERKNQLLVCLEICDDGTIKINDGQSIISRNTH